MTVTGYSVVYGQEVNFEQAIIILRNLFEEKEIQEAIEEKGCKSFEDENMYFGTLQWVFDNLLKESDLIMVEIPHDIVDESECVFGIFLGSVDFGEYEKLPSLKKINKKKVDTKLAKLALTQNAYHFIPNDCNCCS